MVQKSWQYATLIDRAVSLTSDEIRRSKLGQQEVLEELLEVQNECARANWDGYNALPVRQVTFAAAYALIMSLPLGFPGPSIGAEPDGQLTLEWHKSERRTLSVSVDADGFLHYAGLFGQSKRYGTLAFFSTVPSELIQLVRDL